MSQYPLVGVIGDVRNMRNELSSNCCIKIQKAYPGLTQDIAYICEILHCNHFIIPSNATAYGTTTINSTMCVPALWWF